MKTRKHGKGMNHTQVVKFSNRLAYAGTRKKPENETTAFDDGWEAACKYFAHELRKLLREIESAQ